MTKHVKRRLQDLLMKERKAIQSGNLNDLKSLVAKKEALAKELESSSIEISELRELKQEAERNEIHLHAAKLGIESVQGRLKQLIDGGRSFKTYSANGASQTITNPISQTNKTV